MRIIRDLISLNPANLTNDDVTVLLFRPNGTTPARPLREKLLAPLRVAKAIVGSIGRQDEPAPWPEVSVANLGGALVPSLGKVGQTSAASPRARER